MGSQPHPPSSPGPDGIPIRKDDNPHEPLGATVEVPDEFPPASFRRFFQKRQQKGAAGKLDTETQPADPPTESEHEDAKSWEDGHFGDFSMTSMDLALEDESTAPPPARLLPYNLPYHFEKDELAALDGLESKIRAKLDAWRERKLQIQRVKTELEETKLRATSTIQNPNIDNSYRVLELQKQLAVLGAVDQLDGAYTIQTAVDDLHTYYVEAKSLLAMLDEENSLAHEVNDALFKELHNRGIDVTVLLELWEECGESIKVVDERCNFEHQGNFAGCDVFFFEPLKRLYHQEANATAFDFWRRASKEIERFCTPLLISIREQLIMVEIEERRALVLQRFRRRIKKWKERIFSREAIHAFLDDRWDSVDLSGESEELKEEIDKGIRLSIEGRKMFVGEQDYTHTVHTMDGVVEHEEYCPHGDKEEMMRTLGV